MTFLQTLTLTADKTKVIIDRVRVCKNALTTCKTATELPVYISATEMEIKEVCIECTTNNYRVVKINTLMPTVPFFVDATTWSFERNIQTPYFECEPVTSEIDDCKFYMNYEFMYSNPGRLFITGD